MTSGELGGLARCLCSHMELVLRVVVFEGKGFGNTLQALRCTASLGEAELSTPFSVGRDVHDWHAAVLSWKTLSRDHLRKLSSAGQYHCKVVVTGKDARDRVGWVLLDLRRAKLNNRSSDTQGEWLQLSGVRPGGGSPQIRVHYSLIDQLRSTAAQQEAQLMQQLDSKLDKGGTSTQGERPQPAHGQSETAGALPPIGEEDYSDDFDDGSDHGRTQQQQGSAAAPLNATEGNAGTQQQQRIDNATSYAEQPTTAAPRPSQQAGAMSVDAQHGSHSHGGMGSSAGGASVSSGGAAQPGPAAAQGPSLPAAGTTLPSEQDILSEGPFRSFALTLDIRTFQAGRKLPLNTCSTYIQALLPADVLELVVASGHLLPAKMAPLRTYPAVDVARGQEAAIPNGVGTVEFTAGVVHLARVLARDPRITVEVWHKEKFRSDTLVGVASVPLSPLLYDCWVDGYGPVYALAAPGAHPAGAQPERVEVGMLRVVIALEDKGPAPPPQPAAAIGSPPRSVMPAQPGQSTRYAAPPSDLGVAMQGQVNQPTNMYAGGSLPAQAATQSQEPMPTVTTWYAQPSTHQHGTLQAPAFQPVQPSISTQPPPGAPTYMPGSPGAGGAYQQQWQVLPSRQQIPLVPQLPPVASLPPQVPITAVQSLPEYEAAYQLEVWKKSEEVRWRAELREREAARMAVLEGEWRRREKAREAELAAMRAEYSALDEKARQVLAAAEERERRLVAAEEASQRRKKDLEREHAARMLEAEAAVRRLQIECEHQLEIERDRSAELARQRSSLEERLAVAEARHAALEQAFAAYREQMRGTSEAALQRELLEVRDALRRAEERGARAVKAKAAYKDQVVKLAEQLASLYRAQQQREAEGLLGREGRALKLVAEEHARVSSAQQDELSALRQQLRALKDSALASLSPPRDNRDRTLAGALTPGGRAAVAQVPWSAGRGRSGADEDVVRRGYKGGGDQGLPAQLHSYPAVRPVTPGAAGGAPASSAGGSSTPEDLLAEAQRQVALQRQQQQMQAQGPSQQQHQQQEAGLSVSLTLRDMGQGQGVAGYQEPAVPQQQQQHSGLSPRGGGGGGSLGNSSTEAPAQLHEGTPTKSRPPTDGAPTPTFTDGAAMPPSQPQPPGTTASALPAHPLQSRQVSPSAADAGAAGHHEAAVGEEAAPASLEALLAQIEQQQQGAAAGRVSVSTASTAPGNANEIRRLLRRKSELLATGAYERSDPLIARIEARVAQLAGLPPPQH